MKTIVSYILLTVCLFTYTACNDTNEDGSRGFSTKATIVGDAEGGYHCYLDQGGLVISQSGTLDGVERGYFSFYYTKDDEIISDGLWQINHAYAAPIEVFDIIYPITKEEANALPVTDKDRCAIPSFPSIGYGSNGYIDLSASFDTFNRESGETTKGKVNIVYDPDKQETDTLRLQLCYNPSIPESWSKISGTHRTLSCDISSLAALQQWNDSITVVVDYGDKDKPLKRKISKNDFLKPNQKEQ